MFFWNCLAFLMIQRMLAVWSLVPLPFLNPAWTSGSSWFMYCWSLDWRILSINLFRYSWGIPVFGCLLRRYGSAVDCCGGRSSGYSRPGYGISPLGGGHHYPTIDLPKLTSVFYISDIIWYLYFSAWLTSFSLTISRSIQVDANLIFF